MISMAAAQAAAASRKVPPFDSRPLSDTLQFMQMLWALMGVLDRTSKHMAIRIGVTGPQRLVLRLAGLRPGVSAGELAATLHVHPSTLTGVLQRLVQQRLLVRRAYARDRRRAMVQLTARGARINSARTGTVEAAVSRALARVTARDRAACWRVLDALVRELDRETVAGAAMRSTRRRRKKGPPA